MNTTRPEDLILAAMKRSAQPQFSSILPIGIVRAEVCRANESRGLTEAEMEVFAKRINDLCDQVEL